MLPGANARLPLTVMVPIELPGASVPATRVDGTKPMPPKMPPGPTSTSLERVMSPFTFSRPPTTLVWPL